MYLPGKRRDRALPEKYESGVILAQGEWVIVHGRFSKFGLPVDWIAADILRVKEGTLLEQLGCHSG